MNTESLTDIQGLLRSALHPLPNGSVAEWCESNLILPAPQTQEPGALSFSGREYLRELVQDFGEPTVTDSVACFGSQTGKTTALMAGVAWCLRNDPSGCLWVMPSIDLARSFSETRWQPMVKASPSLEALVPVGRDRHDFKKTQQRLGASVINFIGSNSPANLASRPARLVVLDEVDKFDEGGRGEADAVNLAEQRTKSFANPKRIKTSTPTLDIGLIWQEFLKGDQRRYFVPCPHCSKHVVFAWSKPFTVFPLTGSEAFVKWDAEARGKDAWDLARVERSAHAVCPHCGGEIEDGHKTKMVRDGEWRATTANAPIAFKSRHLPSLYATAPETTFGRLAVKFLQAKRSLLGLQGFINGDLAEPYISQDRQGERLELITARLEPSKDVQTLMTVDCQASSPHYWFVVRAWRSVETCAVEAGSVDTWEELREKQQHHKIPDVAVMVDSGWGARSEADVYRTCARFGEIVPSQIGRGVAMGWMPAKGMPGRKRWKSDDGVMVPYYLRPLDPFTGTADAGQVEMSLFEFSADYFKDLLQSMRENRGLTKWSVTAKVATEEYWRHMDAEVKTAVFNRVSGRTTHEWRPRSKSWPNHLLDCEVQQIAMAAFFGLFPLEEPA